MLKKSFTTFNVSAVFWASSSANNNLKLQICCWSKTFLLRVLSLHSKQPPRSPRRVWNTSLYCIFATTCQEGSFGEWHIYSLLCQQSRYHRKFDKDSVGKIQSLRRAQWAFQPQLQLIEFIFRNLVLCEEAVARHREFTNLIIICLRPVSEEIKSISNRSSLPFVLNPLVPIS